MRKFNLETDSHIVDEAVANVGRGGGCLTAVKRALNDAGIEFPANFNSSKSLDALQIDAAILVALDKLPKSD